MLTRTRLSARLAAALLVMAAVTALGDTPPVRAYAITDVTLIPMKTDGASPSQTVIVRDGRVAAIGPTSLIRAPTDSVVIHGAGLALLPGLADMHVHLRRQDLDAYLAHGITTVRNMWGHPGIRELQREIELGDVIGPHVYSTSPGVDGSPPSWPLTRLVDDPANAAAVVDALYAEGWRTIKLYNNLSSETYESIVGAARARGMDFAGHVPIAVDLEAALAAGQDGVPCRDDPAYRLLDFWVGEWDVLVRGVKVGRNRIEKLLDGCALLEIWTDTRGREGGDFSTASRSPANGARFG